MNMMKYAVIRKFNRVEIAVEIGICLKGNIVSFPGYSRSSLPTYPLPPSRTQCGGALYVSDLFLPSADTIVETSEVRAAAVVEALDCAHHTREILATSTRHCQAGQETSHIFIVITLMIRPYWYPSICEASKLTFLPAFNHGDLDFKFSVKARSRRQKVENSRVGLSIHI